MEKEELTVKDLFENQVLEDLFENRDDGFKCAYEKIFGKLIESQKVEEIEDKLQNTIEQTIKDETIKNKILEIVNEYRDCLVDEKEIWEKIYYKYGVLDGKYMNKELVQICLLNKHIREHKKGIIFNKIMNTIREIIKCKKD